MEGGFGFPFGGDPDDLMRSLREFAEQQSEAVAESQREQFATLTLNTAVELTAAALGQMEVSGHVGRAGDRAARRHARALPRVGRARLAPPSGLHARGGRKLGQHRVAAVQTIVWPRIIAASGEARNATASATSSGSTSRPAGVRLA